MKSFLLNKKNITLSLFSAIFVLFLFEILSYTIIKHTSVLDKYFFHKHKLLDEEDFNSYAYNNNNNQNITIILITITITLKITITITVISRTKTT